MALTVFIRGDRIDLCVLDPEGDLAAYEAWVNDQETTRYMAVGKRPTTRRELQEYIAGYKGLLLGLCVRQGGAHVGNIALHSLDAQNRQGEVGILIGDSASRGKGYGTEALKLLADHAFRRMNLNKLTAGLVDGNIASQKAFEKAGFRREGTLREHFYLDGRYLDYFRYGLLRREFLEAAGRDPKAARGA